MRIRTSAESFSVDILFARPVRPLNSTPHWTPSLQLDPSTRPRCCAKPGVFYVGETWVKMGGPCVVYMVPCGVYVESMWGLCVVHGVLAWSMAGPCGVHVWSIWGPCVVHMGFMWGLCGVHVRSIWGPCGFLAAPSPLLVPPCYHLMRGVRV